MEQPEPSPKPPRLALIRGQRATAVRSPAAAPPSSLLEQLQEVRVQVEAGAAALAAQRGGEWGLAGMRRALGQPPAGPHPVGEGTRGDLAFHLRMAEAGGNPLVGEFLRWLYARLAVLGQGPLAGGGQADAPSAVQARLGHQEIYLAVARGDAQAAGQAARRHVLEGARRRGLELRDFETGDLPRRESQP